MGTLQHYTITAEVLREGQIQNTTPSPIPSLNSGVAVACHEGWLEPAATLTI